MNHSEKVVIHSLNKIKHNEHTKFMTHLFEAQKKYAILKLKKKFQQWNINGDI